MTETKSKPKAKPKPKATPKPKAPAKPKTAPKVPVEVKPVQKPKRVEFEKMRIVALRKFAKKNGIKRWSTRTRRGLYSALRKKGL